jgi:ubiquinone/menaquinone biosynthesis C-methylase UbiE
MTTDLQHWLETGGVTFLRRVGVTRGAVVLDFGCRRGTYAIPAARIVGAEGLVYAVDRNAEALAEVSEAAHTYGLSPICCINTGGAVTLPLADAVCDVALLYDVIHLIGYDDSKAGPPRKSTSRDRKQLLVELRRVLRLDGLLSVFVQHLDTHTDVTAEATVRREIAACGFRFCGTVEDRLMHDEQPLAGHVLNFCCVDRAVDPGHPATPRTAHDCAH